jgi:hypothetical protein
MVHVFGHRRRDRESRPKARLPTTSFDEDGNEIEPAAEEEEVELDDLKLKVPKDQAQKLKDAFLRQADYTRKTQEVAELRKAVEAERQTVHQSTKRRSRARRTCGRSTSNSPITADRLGRIRAAGPFRGSEPIGASFSSSKMPAHRAPANTRSSTAARLAAQQETAKRIEEGRAVLAREIPGGDRRRRKRSSPPPPSVYGFSGSKPRKRSPIPG